VTKSPDLHGSAPDSAPVALLLIDVINEMRFAEGPALLRHALPMARRLRRLKRRAKAVGIPAIYVNDNFGRWRSDFAAIVRRCCSADSPGHPVARLMIPEADDYFVLKPKHSGFYASSLGILLEYLGPRRLLLTGVSGPLCVFFTASDAHMREYQLSVPADCVASPDTRQNRQALAFMRDLFRADIRPSSRLDLRRLVRAGGSPANRVAGSRPRPPGGGRPGSGAEAIRRR
jgi:nicotinamidase-related amidase